MRQRNKSNKPEVYKRVLSQHKSRIGFDARTFLPGGESRLTVDA